MRKKLTTAIAATTVWLALAACQPYLVVHRGFRLKHDGQDRPVPLRLTGCYVYAWGEYEFASRIFLYADGSAALSGLRAKTREQALAYTAEDAPSGKRRVSGFYWGRYEITGDQLLVQLVRIRPPWDNGLAELTGEVANDSTLLIKRWHIKRFDTTYAAPRVYRLDPQIPKPDSLNWLRRKRWYYADGKVPEGER
jgi:hypothetical protein